jgi:outer membrane protein
LNMYLNSIVSSLLLAFLAAPLFAQAPLSLAEATHRAAAQNRDLLQSAAAVKARAEDARVARTRRWPSLSTTAQVGPLLNQAHVTFTHGALGNFASTGPIPANDQNVGIPRRLGGYSLSQFSLPLSQQPRLGLNVALADQETAATAEQKASLQLNVVAQVRGLYFQIVGLEAARKAADAQVEAAHETLRLAREAVAKGTALDREQAAAEARLAQSEADAAGLETDIQNGREQLNLLLGEPLTTQFTLIETAPAATATSEDEARRQAMAARPQVKEARIRLEQARLSERAKRLEYVPDINLAVTYAGFFNSTNFLPNQFAIAGLSLNWEPWDWGRKRHEAAGLRDKEEQARLALQQAEQQAAFEAAQAWREMERARRNLEAAHLAVESTKENLRVVREQYAKQAALLGDVLEAQSRWEAAGQQQARAVAANGVAWANFQSALGTEE